MSLDKQQIARQFTRAAGTYDEVAQLQSAMADGLIDRLANQTTGTLIDLGCGTGSALEKLANRFEFRLMGFDLSPGMIAIAKKRFAELAQSTSCTKTPLGNVSFHIADLEETTLPDGCADVVFSNAAIQWCESKSAFEEMARILKPGGQLLLTTFGPQTLRQWKRGWVAIGDHHARIHEFETESSLRSSLLAAGFESFELNSELHELHFNSVKSMFAGIKRLGATNAATNRPPGLLGRERYLQLCDYFQRALDKTGHLAVTFECVTIFAHR